MPASIEVEVREKFEPREIREALDILPVVHRSVILLRYGFETNEKTLAEVGRVLGLTQERIRQIQLKGEYLLRSLILGADSRGGSR